MLRQGHCRYAPANAFALPLMVGITAGDEIIEGWYAVLEDGHPGIEFLGSRGDICDAQKDTLGAVAALPLFEVVRPDQVEPRAATT
jgi:uncharacterized membrane protein YjdF